MPAPTPPHAPLKLDDESVATAGDLLDAQLWLLPAEYWCGTVLRSCFVAPFMRAQAYIHAHPFGPP
jgi:hypothetical protein